MIGGAEEINSRPFTTRTFRITATAKMVCAREIPNMTKNGQKERTGEFYRAGQSKKAKDEERPKSCMDALYPSSCAKSG